MDMANGLQTIRYLAASCIVDIEKNKIIYSYATIGDNDDELEVADISTLMKDKKLLSSYDKAFVFYAIFK